MNERLLTARSSVISCLSGLSAIPVAGARSVRNCCAEFERRPSGSACSGIYDRVKSARQLFARSRTSLSSLSGELMNRHFSEFVGEHDPPPATHLEGEKWVVSFSEGRMPTSRRCGNCDTCPTMRASLGFPKLLNVAINVRLPWRDRQPYHRWSAYGQQVPLRSRMIPPPFFRQTTQFRRLVG